MRHPTPVVRKLPGRRLNRALLPEVMDLEEVGEVLGLSRDGVRQLIRRKHLRAGHLGRRLFVRREWLFAALDQAEGNAPGAGPTAAAGSGDGPGCPPSSGAA